MESVIKTITTQTLRQEVFQAIAIGLMKLLIVWKEGNYGLKSQ
jgi:hypothetical protein